MKVEDKIKVLLVKPKCNPEVIEVKNNLYALQSLVDGYIELVEVLFPFYHIIVCNEEGKLESLPPNRQIGRDIIVGAFFITKVSNGEFISLGKKETEELSELYSLDSTEFRAIL